MVLNEKTRIKIYLLVIFLLIVFSVVFYVISWRKYAHCIQVKEPSQYHGNSRIGYNGKAVIDKRALYQECIELDKKVDNSDGNERGKVRWFRCFMIDCDEMY